MSKRAVVNQTAPLLSVRGLEVAYGPVTAVRGVSFTVQPGEIVALLGANGAGKTSTLRGLTGLVKPRAGSVSVDGSRVVPEPGRLVAAGIAHVPEGRRVFPTLSVDQNLTLGAWRRSSESAAQRELVFGMFPRLAERRKQSAGQLSGGEQQMMAIGRALMTAPRLLMIDELSLGLAPIVVDQLIAGLIALNRDGMALVLIEQFVHRALAIANTVHLMAKGGIVFSGTPAEADRAGALELAYLSEVAS